MRHRAFQTVKELSLQMTHSESFMFFHKLAHKSMNAETLLFSPLMDLKCPDGAAMIVQKVVFLWSVIHIKNCCETVPTEKSLEESPP